MGAFGGEAGGRGVPCAGQCFGAGAGFVAAVEQVERGVLLRGEVGGVGFGVFDRRGRCRPGDGAVEAVDMDLQRAGEGGDRGEEALLQADEAEACLRTPGGGQGGDPCLAQGAIVGEHRGEREFGGGFGQMVEDDRFDQAFGEAFAECAQVAFEAADHDRFEVCGPHRDPAREALRIEQFEQGGEAVRVAVMRCRREEQPMFEPVGQVA